MSAISDLLNLLDKWPRWRRMKEAPDRLEALEARIAALEERLSDRPPGDACPACKKPAYRVVRSAPHATLGDRGVSTRTHLCEECGFEETSTGWPGM